MFPKRLLAIGLFAAVLIHGGLARGQWVQTNGPCGGDASCFAMMGTYIFAGAYDAGVFCSTDSGSSWKTIKNFSGVDCLVVLGSTIVTATYDGLYFSTDSGAHWTQSTNIWSSVLAPIVGMVSVGRKLYATQHFDGGGTANYSSLDSGKSWAQDSLPLGGGVFVVRNGTIFAAVDSGIFVSYDEAKTWNMISTKFKDSSVLSLDFLDSTLFAVVSSRSFTHEQLYVSTDKGASWHLTTALPRGIPRFIVECDSLSSLLIVCGDSGLFLSTNNGDMWIDGGFADYYIETAAVLDNALLAATVNGLYRSTDSGSTWKLSGLPSTNIYSMTTQGSNLVAGSFFGFPAANVFFSTDNGSSWTKTSYASMSIGDPVETLAAKGTTIFAPSDDYGLLRSTDSGKTWASLGRNNINSFYCLLINDTTMFAGTDGDEILRSTDGSNWTLLNSGLTNYALNNNVTALTMIGSTMIAATSNAGIFRSPNGGSSWSISNSGLTDTDILALVAIDSIFIAATYPDGVFRSTDFGDTWTWSNDGLKNRYVYDFVMNGANIFAGTDSGVFLSTNNGRNWISANTGLPGSIIHALVINNSNLFAGTDSFGVWRRPLSDFGISSVAQTAPSSPMEIQSYPNPFSQSTTITFTSESQGYADLHVVNLLGAEVAHLFSGELSAGEHSFTWDANGFAPGMYECILRLNGRAERVPMIYSR